MKARRPNRGSERRRNLAEVNLLAENRSRVVPSRRGCVLPFIGIGILALALATALGGPSF
ncbi:MAG: hypothetical protein ACHQ7M_17765 [Chloroflexota bacterium]